MRILFITNNFPPLVDGVGDYTYNIAQQFIKHGHKVYIICSKNPQINININGITIFPIINKWNFNCYKPIVRLIKEKEINIVSLQYVPHGFHPKGVPFPIIRLVNQIKKTNASLFTFCHELLVLPEPFNIKRLLLSCLMKYITRTIINRSDIAATSNDFYKYIAEQYIKVNKELHIIPIASNIQFQEYSQDYIKNLRSKIAKSDEIIIAFFGNRNTCSSIEVINKIIQEGGKIKILAIGNTTIPDYGINKMNIYKTGIISVNEISKYFQISDFLLLPENTGYGCSFKSGSLIAALQNGVTVITTKGKMTSNLLIDKKNIIFADFDNKELLKKQLIWCINNTSICKEISNCAKVQFSFINWESTYTKYIEFITNKYNNE